MPSPVSSFFVTLALLQAPPYAPASFPEEVGYQKRVSGMVERYRKKEIGTQCFALSVCPDTGLPVRTLAVEGELIYSPYTGRAYVQGDTGYFGPKKRGADGRITAFGGDPLKQDLPPAMARLLQNPNDSAMKAWLTVPGNLNQQYHFAAVNWARLYSLLAPKMGEPWQRDFRNAVATYSENRRPVDETQREWISLSVPHDLIGEPGELLGGNAKDGGTEAQKTMWRTSGLLYAQTFPATALVSGKPVAEAERLITPMLTGYLRTILTTGNGEYDSSTDYPYSLRGYFNLYDFSPRPQVKALAQATLDYYVASYGLKCLNGVHAGAAKRGWAGNGDTLGDMDMHLWLWTGSSTVPVSTATLLTSIHQATTTYRPNRVIHNLITKNVPLPFEAQIARPTSHSKERNAFQETFYCERGFALGSVAMTQVDNPAQQTVWSLVTKASDRSFVFGGGQPRFRSPEGHSPHDQTLQKRGAMLLITGQRNRYSADALQPLEKPQSDADESFFWENAPRSAATWLFVPRTIATNLQKHTLFFEAGEAFVMVRPFGGGEPFWFDPDVSKLPKEAEILTHYRVYVIPAGPLGFSGFALDTVKRSAYPDLFAFADAALARTALDTTKLPVVTYKSLYGDTLLMRYQPSALRAEGVINGKKVEWAKWADGGVYASPYLTIKDSKMTVSDGRESYTLTVDRQNFPVWQ